MPPQMNPANPDPSLVHARLTTPRAAALAGIVFSLLYMTSLVLIYRTIPTDPQEAGAWLESGRRTVDLALYLLPFAGIAFLWFIGVLRDRLGVLEDRFFATVFLGSGLLFLAMLFVAGGLAAGVMISYRVDPDRLMGSGIFTFARAAVYQIVNIYGQKMAGVFMISTSTIALRSAIFPRWMAFLGFGLALVLLFSVGHLPWTPLVFPLWVLLISGHILLANLKPCPGQIT